MEVTDAVQQSHCFSALADSVMLVISNVMSWTCNTGGKQPEARSLVSNTWKSEMDMWRLDRYRCLISTLDKS